MKHIKEYTIFEGEYYTDDDIKRMKDNLPKFAKYIRKIIMNFGYECVNFSEDEDIQFSFYLKNTEKVLFSIMTGNDEYFVLDSFNNSNDIIISSIPEYMKTIKGIRFNKKVSDEYEFYIEGNVNDIINQIDNEKIKLFAITNKFNI